MTSFLFSKVETNPHVRSEYYFLQASFNNKVRTDNLDEELKINIHSILDPVSDETVDGVIEAIKYAGLESMSDLEFVHEDDLILVLKPIQRRKLVKAWSEQSSATNHLKDPVLPIKTPSPSQIPTSKKCKWKAKKCLVLLQVYTKYKMELLCPDVEQGKVWEKISDEVQLRCSINCDAAQCRNKIEELRIEYEKIRNNAMTGTKRRPLFMVDARNAFEQTCENSDSATNHLKDPVLPIKTPEKSKKCKWKAKKCLVLLQVYTKYKMELLHPGVEQGKVWKKISDEVKLRCSINCNAARCRKKIEELRIEYENLRNNPITSAKRPLFMIDAKNAFEQTCENLVTSNSQVGDNDKVGKYIPPHLRNQQNWPITSTMSAITKIFTSTYPVEVRNFSENVKQSDLQELFGRFGTIASINLKEDPTGQSKNFALVNFQEKKDATAAISNLNGFEYNNFILKVDWAKTFDMNSFKKVYSNAEKNVSIKYFWDTFDEDNYSIWFCEYSFPEELTFTHMSCNLIGGMFQRLGEMRKVAFASVCLFGEDNNSTISGIWVWRGHELIFTLSNDWRVDYGSYRWKKLDPTLEETKKLVNEYFTWSGDFGGKKFNQGKLFK